MEFMRKEAAENALSLDGTSFMSRILKVCSCCFYNCVLVVKVVFLFTVKNPFSCFSSKLLLFQ